MSIVTHRSLRSGVIENRLAGGALVPACFAIVLAAAVVLAVYTPPAVIVPALALVATLLSAICGATGWLATGTFKARALAAAGIFAFAAIAAAMVGDPDQVALWLQ